MKDLRIVFMGTPDFAVASLKAIYEAKYNIVGVLTAPDRPAGRGQKLRQSAVKEYALEKGLMVLQPTNLKNSDFIKELKALQANVQVIVAFRMLPEVVWAMPKYGTFNLHASLLPEYRGAAPINWALINGETKTGVTTFFIDEKIDTGEIILQEEVDITPDEDAGNLHDKLMNLGSKLVLETLALIESGKITTQPQPKRELKKTAYKLDRDNTQIDWSKSIDTIFNLIRGLSPYPVAWSIFINDGKEETMKIYQAEKIISLDQNITPNSDWTITVEGSEIFVNLPDGKLKIKELQLPGKRKMKAKDLLNGYSFKSEARMV